jgi:hypothetical protein
MQALLEREREETYVFAQIELIAYERDNNVLSTVLVDLLRGENALIAVRCWFAAWDCKRCVLYVHTSSHLGMESNDSRDVISYTTKAPWAPR